MITRITNLCISSYQGFSVDKSLIKKLYSWKDRSRKSKRSAAINDDFDAFMDSNQKKIKNSISARSVFSYFYSQAYIDWFWQ